MHVQGQPVLSKQLFYLQGKLHIKKATFALWKPGSVKSHDFWKPDNVRSHYFIQQQIQTLKSDTFSQAKAACSILQGKLLLCSAGWKSLQGNTGKDGHTSPSLQRDIQAERFAGQEDFKHNQPSSGNVDMAARSSLITSARQKD